jgi:hypothetical protein
MGEAPREVAHPNHYSSNDDDDDDLRHENDEDDAVSTTMLLEWLQLEDYYHFPRTWWCTCSVVSSKYK